MLLYPQYLESVVSILRAGRSVLTALGKSAQLVVGKLFEAVAELSKNEGEDVKNRQQISIFGC